MTQKLRSKMPEPEIDDYEDDYYESDSEIPRSAHHSRDHLSRRIRILYL